MGEQNEREAYNEAAREDYEGREREAMDRPMFTQREVDAAIAAAVQAEREAILSRLESLKSAALAHGMPDAFGLGVACGVVKGRGTVTPSPSPAVDVREQREQISPIDGAIDDMVRILRDPKADADEKNMALSTLADAVGVEFAPSVDVMEVVGELIDAKDAHGDAYLANCMDDETEARLSDAWDALRALVAPRTAEESKGEV